MHDSKGVRILKAFTHNATREAIDHYIKGTLKYEVDTDNCGQLEKFNAYLFIMASKELPNHVFIGWDRECRATRLRCQDDLELLYYTRNKIPNADRVRELIFEELRVSRRIEDGCMCGQKHADWVAVSGTKASGVLERWARWMLKDPYERQSGGLRAFWISRLEGYPRMGVTSWNEWVSVDTPEGSADWTDNGERIIVMQAEKGMMPPKKTYTFEAMFYTYTTELRA